MANCRRLPLEFRAFSIAGRIALRPSLLLALPRAEPVEALIRFVDCCLTPQQLPPLNVLSPSFA
jgi:hypothetical protein